MIYLDNAATTFPKPPEVISGMSAFMTTTMANPGRSGHQMATDTNKAMLESRMKLARLIGADNPLQIAFTKNASEALNMALFGCLDPDDHVITTMLEHNSVARPLHKLESDGSITLTVVPGDDEGFVSADEIIGAINEHTALVVMTHASNLLGSINDIEAVGKALNAYNEAHGTQIQFMVDCAQTLGSVPIDVEAMHIHLLAGAGHKGVYGPTGTGFLYVHEEVDIGPIYIGGTGSLSESLNQPEFMPDMLETGTINAVGIVGLGIGIDYVMSKGVEVIGAHTQQLVSYTLEALRKIPHVICYGSMDAQRRAGVVSFNIGEMDSQEVAGLLSSEFDIATRGGMHCAPLAHQRMGTLDQGMVRASFGSFSTQSDADALIAAATALSARLTEDVHGR